MIKYRLTIVLSVMLLTAAAQENILLHPDKFYKKFFPHMKIHRVLPDSAYIKMYPNYLSTGAHILLPAIFVNITDRQTNEVLKFRTNIADVIGFNASYRSVSAGFAFLSKPPLLNKPGYETTAYHTATINYSGQLYSFQFKYLKLLGMTDVDIPAGKNEYAKRSDLSLKEYHFESLYNINWKKYSYQAPLDFSQWQVKSRGGFLVKTGVYYSELLGDSNLVSKNKGQYFENFNGIRGIRRFSVRIAPGVGGTYVFMRRFYFAAALFVSNDLYFYRYVNSDGSTTTKRERYVLGIDGYASVGFQSKRFFSGIKYEINGSQAMLQDVQVNIFYSFSGLTLGYRFNTPNVIRKFYKKTMPPGM